MGKASRVRNAKLAVAELKREEQLALERANRKKKRNNIIIASVSTFLCVAFIVGLVLLNWVQTSGTLLRSKTAMKTDSLSVSGTTFNYFFNYQYQNFVNDNSSYLSYYGLDTSTSLKAQQYSEDQSWFEFFLSQTQKSLNEILILATEAKAQNIELTDSDKKQIEDFFVTLKEAAEQAGEKYEDYIQLAYGKGVNEQDIRKGLEISLLSTRFYTDKIDSVNYSDKQITDYFNKNKNDFLFVDYKTYTFNPAATESMTDKEKQAEYDKVNKRAERLSKAKTAEEFDKILTEILKELDTTDANIKTAISDSVSKGNIYDKEFAVSKWAFEEGKVGESYVYKNSNARTVYLLTKAPYRDENETRSVRHILISKDSYDSDEAAKKKAQEVLDEYLKGEKTAEKFGELAEKYTEDTGSKTTGGLYESFPKGQMVEEFESWSFDNKRKEGDTEIVKTTYGYHIMYFVGKGEVNWKNQVVATLKDNAYTTLYEGLEEKIKVESDNKVLNDITEIRLYSQSTQA